MRFFQRCFNRADVKMEYSAGYNPHQKMSFAQPLGVGIISKGEYLDAEIADGQDLDEICKNLNEVCGDGFEVINVRAVEEGAKKAMAALQFASYNVDVRGLVPVDDCDAVRGLVSGDDCDDVRGLVSGVDSDAVRGLVSVDDRDAQGAASDADAYTSLQEKEDLDPETFNSFDKTVSRAINDLLLEEHIPVIKTTKSGQKEVDIRPQIIQLSFMDGAVHMVVTAGSDNNLKPDTLLSAIFSKTNIEYHREKIKITREELFADGFVPLDQFQCHP